MRRAVRGFCQFVFGMTTYELVLEARRQQRELYDLFIALTFGDLIGLPVHPSPISLRLLPYVALDLSGWRRRVVRPRDVLDLCGEDVG